MDNSTIIIESIGPGTSGYDPLRAIPEPAVASLIVLGLAIAVIVSRINRRTTAKYKAGKLTPMPDYLRYK